MIKRKLLTEILSPCCEADCFSISSCSSLEKDMLIGVLPECKSVIVLAHHIKSAIEWMWFPLESERNNVTCPADLHLKSECEKMLPILAKKGYTSVIMPYPGRSGLRFKDMASKTGLGSMGDNFMFLHREWGPWTHLRVIITDAEITENLSSCGDVCIHCGICKSTCPAHAIKNDAFSGVECNTYQISRDNEMDMKGSSIFKCEECTRACPIGTTPSKITISHTVHNIT